jgi:hypothetical protein
VLYNTDYPCITSKGVPDFTVWEEVDATNSVEPWPSFNIHSLVWTPLSAISWVTYSSGTPNGFAGQVVTASASTPGGTQNSVDIDNEPWASWIGTWFGNGQVTATINGAQANTISEPIDPLADPSGGYDVYYYFTYCPSGFPCSDVSFSPTLSLVQPDSDFYSPNANMVVTLPADSPGLGIYPMNLYAYDPYDESYYMTQWILDVNYVG